MGVHGDEEGAYGGGTASQQSTRADTHLMRLDIGGGVTHNQSGNVSASSDQL